MGIKPAPKALEEFRGRERARRAQRLQKIYSRSRKSRLVARPNRVSKSWERVDLLGPQTTIRDDSVLEVLSWLERYTSLASSSRNDWTIIS